MNKFKFITFIFVFISQVAISYSAGCPGLCNPLEGVGGVDDLLVKVTQAIAYFAFPILVLAYVYTGFKFVSAMANPEKLSKAKSMFLWTTVAAILILGAPVFIEILVKTVNELKG